MWKKLSWFIIFISVLMVKAQDNSGYADIVRAESRLALMFDELYSIDDTARKAALFQNIDSLFLYAVNLPGSFDHQWQKLDKIGKLKSDDDQLKVFSWLYMINRNEYRYRAYMQVSDGKSGAGVFRLRAGNAEGIKSETYPQKIEDWHGKVYYQLITTSEKRRTYYTLLGLDMNDAMSAIKTVEVLSVRRGKPQFIEKRILDEGKVKDRLVLEYSSDVTASLRYNEELKMIVFDHLAPLHPLYHGNYQFYGPDGSYDGLKFIEGVWVREEDVDARNME